MKINKFRIKLYTLIIIFLVVPIILCCVILFFISENTIKTYAYNNMGSTLKKNVQNIESQLDVLDSASTSLLLNLTKIPEVTDSTLNADSAEIFQSTQDAFTVSSSLIVDTYSINGYNKFYLYFPTKSLLIVSNMSFFDNVNYNTMDCLSIPQNCWALSNTYENLVCNPIIGKYLSERNISKNYTLTNGKNPMDDIVLTVNLKEDYISNQLSTGFQLKPDYAIIIDSRGNLISSLDESEIGNSVPVYEQMLALTKNSNTGYFHDHELMFNGTSYILNTEFSPGNDWYYITALDENVVTRSISSSIFNAMSIMIIGLLILSFFITAFLIRSTTSPLNNLIDAMKEMKNKNFKFQLAANRGDEFEVIYSGFNEMAREIDILIQTITEKNNINTKTSIRLLQSEINPHMLYNSLESLYSIAKINNQEEISSLVMALSKFFRISLSRGKRLVPFREAFELANQYIIVQNIRLNYKIDFEYDIPEDLLDILTPKFLLQPIVENTFHYGFKNRRETCRLKINAFQEEDCVKIIVWDNGIGINESDLNRILKDINNFDYEVNVSRKGYALSNINYQIKLEFGEIYGISIESIYGEYTKVIIKIPKIMEEEQPCINF